MNHSDWSKKDLEYIWHPCSQMKDYETLPPIVVDHGKGVNLYDVDGKRYLDVVSSWWCNLLGHSHPKINRAIKEQLDSLEHVIFANFSHRPAITLCEELMKKIPRGLCKFNFSDNGSASIESAMKMSFQYHYQTGNRQKVRFMSLSDAYHGETLGALSAGGLDLYSELYKPLLLDIVRIPAPDCYRCPNGNKRGCCQAECIDAAQEAFARHGDECAALLVEPLLQGSAGMRMYPPAYLAKLRSLCDAYNVHLIADEIATGFGRTGEHVRLRPSRRFPRHHVRLQRAHGRLYAHVHHHHHAENLRCLLCGLQGRKSIHAQPYLFRQSAGVLRRSRRAEGPGRGTNHSPGAGKGPSFPPDDRGGPGESSPRGGNTQPGTGERH